MNDNVDVTILCTHADLAACNSYAATLEGVGPNCISIPLSTQPGVTDRAQATHWGGSGWNPAPAVDAMIRSLDPKFFVLSNDGTTFDGNLANVTINGQAVTLYRINEPI